MPYLDFAHPGTTSRPSYESIWTGSVYAVGTQLTVGALVPARTVSAALNILGVGQQGDFALYHQVLNRARWSPLQLSRVRLLLVAGRLGSSNEPLVFGIDETVERRWGRKIAAKGRYRDAVRSTDDQVVMTPGLQWVSPCLCLHGAGVGPGPYRVALTERESDGLDGTARVYQAGTENQVDGRIPGFSDVSGDLVDGLPHISAKAVESTPVRRGVYRAGESILVSITYDRPVVVVGNPHIHFQVGPQPGRLRGGRARPRQHGRSNLRPGRGRRVRNGRHHRVVGHV